MTVMSSVRILLEILQSYNNTLLFEIQICQWVFVTVYSAPTRGQTVFAYIVLYVDYIDQCIMI